jgi:hypothetical protein
MTGRERPTPDLRHPAWCSPRRCGVNRADEHDEHQSEPVPIERVESCDARVTMWLSQTIDDPLDESDVWVHVHAEWTEAGEVREVHSEDYRLDQAEQLGAALMSLAGRGRERRYVTEDEWRRSEVDVTSVRHCGRNLMPQEQARLTRVVDAVEKALRAFGDNLDRDRAGRLLAIWKHAGQMTDLEREMVLARFGS